MVEQKIRSFLAIELDPSSTKEVSDFITQIKARFSQFRFIPSTNWHLTLHFFGSLSSEELNRLGNLLPETTAQVKPFTISLKGLGSFPNDLKSRILWIGVEGEIDKLMYLKEVLDQNLLKMKFPLETKPFHPHITIARSQKLINCNLSNPEKEIKFKAQSRIQRVSLFQSGLTSSGAKYSILKNFAI